MITGNKDVDSLILIRLDDRELNIVRETNKYLNSLCEPDVFWLNRILYMYKTDIEYANVLKEWFGFTNWKNTYFFIREKCGDLENLRSYISNIHHIEEYMSLFQIYDWINRDVLILKFKRYIQYTSKYDKKNIIEQCREFKYDLKADIHDIDIYSRN